MTLCKCRKSNSFWERQNLPRPTWAQLVNPFVYTSSTVLNQDFSGRHDISCNNKRSPLISPFPLRLSRSRLARFSQVQFLYLTYFTDFLKIRWSSCPMFLLAYSSPRALVVAHHWPGAIFRLVLDLCLLAALDQSSRGYRRYSRVRNTD
jgi:hypothetical protein